MQIWGLSLDMNKVYVLGQGLCIVGTTITFLWGMMSFNWRKTFLGCVAAFLMTIIGTYLVTQGNDSVVDSFLTYFTIVTATNAAGAAYINLYVYMTKHKIHIIERAYRVLGITASIAFIFFVARIVLTPV